MNKRPPLETKFAHPRVVARAKQVPGKCAVTNDIDGPFVDTGIEYNDRGKWNRLYLHAPWVVQVARDLLHMVPRSEIEAADEKVEILTKKLIASRELLAAYQAQEEAEQTLSEMVNA